MPKPGGGARDGSRDSAAPLPSIPAKRYFTIGEVSELCAVKPHVLRYWEQEFTQLKPIKRSGNRRYYQHHEVLLIRRIRELLYEQGFTINGARNRLEGSASSRRRPAPVDEADGAEAAIAAGLVGNGLANGSAVPLPDLRAELESIRAGLQPAAPASAEPAHDAAAAK